MTDKEIFEKLKKHIEDAYSRVGIESASPVDTVWYVDANGDIIESTLNQKTNEIIKRVVGGVDPISTEDLEEIINEDSLVNKENINVA